jgi:hypothetical protein
LYEQIFQDIIKPAKSVSSLDKKLIYVKNKRVDEKTNNYAVFNTNTAYLQQGCVNKKINN